MKKAVLLMAHGAPRDLDDVEEYVLRIRHGRPLEPALMAMIKERYRLIGGSPLLQWTLRQAEALQGKLRDEKVYVGMRYSRPFVRETVEQMISDGVESVAALCMAPQYSDLTIGAYQKALDEAIATRPLQYSIIPSYARHPLLVRAFASHTNPALQEHPGAFVVFTAHSLPERVLQEGDPYDFEVKETARLVAQALKLTDWRFAYQSQGMTSEKWLGPKVEAVIDDLSAQHVSEILIAPIGFVCDHVEILYDVDIFYREYAEKKSIRLFRTASLNDSPEFVDLLLKLLTEL